SPQTMPTMVPQVAPSPAVRAVASSPTMRAEAVNNTRAKAARKEQMARMINSPINHCSPNGAKKARLRASSTRYGDIRVIDKSGRPGCRYRSIQATIDEALAANVKPARVALGCIFGDTEIHHAL